MSIKLIKIMSLKYKYTKSHVYWCYVAVEKKVSDNKEECGGGVRQESIGYKERYTQSKL